MDTILSLVILAAVIGSTAYALYLNFVKPVNSKASNNLFTIFPLGLFMGFVAVPLATTILEGSLTIGHVFLISLGFVLLWLAASFGTGAIEADRPEAEQIRERGTIAVNAIAGSLMGCAFAALFMLP